ncbi:hypothetical protein LguiA_000022 [Lonicera macranthoides]
MHTYIHTYSTTQETDRQGEREREVVFAWNFLHGIIIYVNIGPWADEMMLLICSTKCSREMRFHLLPLLPSMEVERAEVF